IWPVPTMPILMFMEGKETFPRITRMAADDLSVGCALAPNVARRARNLPDFVVLHPCYSASSAELIGCDRSLRRPRRRLHRGPHRLNAPDHRSVVPQFLGIAKRLERARHCGGQLAAVVLAQPLQFFPFLDAVPQHLPMHRAARSRIEQEF